MSSFTVIPQRKYAQLNRKLFNIFFYLDCVSDCLTYSDKATHNVGPDTEKALGCSLQVCSAELPADADQQIEGCAQLRTVSEDQLCMLMQGNVMWKRPGPVLSTISASEREVNNTALL